METENQNNGSIEIDALEFIKELSITEEEKLALCHVIATICVDYSSAILTNVLEVIYGKSIPDEKIKATILEIVNAFCGNEDIEKMASTLYDAAKGEGEY